MNLPSNYLEQITLRFMQDMLAQGTRSYWHRRADELEACRPVPDRDFNGDATLDQLRERWSRLTLAAEQCRIHGDLFEHDDVSAALVAEMLGWEWLEAIAAAETVDEDAERAKFERFAASWESIPEGVAA